MSTDNKKYDEIIREKEREIKSLERSLYEKDKIIKELQFELIYLGKKIIKNLEQST